MIPIKLANLQGIFKLFITILVLNTTAIYSQESNRNVKLDFLTEENTYYPFGNKLNLNVGFDRIVKSELVIDYFEFEYKKRSVTFSLLIVDSVLYAFDKNKLIEICNKKNQNGVVFFDNYKVESKFNKDSVYPYYEIILKRNKKRFLKNIDYIKLWVTLNSEDLVIITVYDNKHKLLYNGEL